MVSDLGRWVGQRWSDDSYTIYSFSKLSFLGISISLSKLTFWTEPLAFSELIVKKIVANYYSEYIKGKGT